MKYYSKRKRNKGMRIGASHKYINDCMQNANKNWETIIEYNE